MPPRSQPATRDRDYDFSNIGKVGRRTGLTLEARPLDQYGMEEMSGLFSSPKIPSPAAKVPSIVQSIEDTGEQAPYTNGQPQTPVTAKSTRRSNRGASHPRTLPRSASPRKSGITGTAKRSGAIDALAQRQLQQEADDALQDEEDEESRSLEDSAGTPVQMINPKAVSAKAATVRRFSPARTPLRNKVLGRQIKSAHVARISNGNSLVTEDEADDQEENTPSHIQTNHVQGDDIPLDEDPLPAIEDDVSEAPAIPESDPEDEPDLPPPPPPFDDEEEDQTFELPAKTISRRSQQNKANSRRKRRSDAMDDAEGAVSSPAAKRAKRKNDDMTRQIAEQTAIQKEPAKRGRKPLASKATNTKLSARQQKELDGVVDKIRARPGQQGKSLYILRRETPADDGLTHTRSGRVSIKPLAYWRNEGIVYGGSGSPSAAGIADGARFPLNSIKEIVRTEEQYEPPAKRAPKGITKKKSRGKLRQPDHDLEVSDIDLDNNNDIIDPDADDWELDTGTLTGPISIWDNGPQNDTVTTDIAYSASAIETRDVKGSSFRYAKLVSTTFSGSGIVDLPPGGVKKMKNSRKMHMSFFVFQGRVTVEVAPMMAVAGGQQGGTRFSIGKGGFWQVPRGNNYSIENEHGKTARIFFSQACEAALELADD